MALQPIQASEAPNRISDLSRNTLDVPKNHLLGLCCSSLDKNIVRKLESSNFGRLLNAGSTGCGESGGPASLVNHHSSLWTIYCVNYGDQTVQWTFSIVHGLECSIPNKGGDNLFHPIHEMRKKTSSSPLYNVQEIQEKHDDVI